MRKLSRSSSSLRASVLPAKPQMPVMRMRMEDLETEFNPNA
jgi:hypothetical protein